ncbi:MAG TPA: DUF2341 domain-containing protein, partial [Methanomicrobiales archaeon]|nr:DUF2341 domain-containing protein [Methanomicrobiales archaeon]
MDPNPGTRRGRGRGISEVVGTIALIGVVVIGMVIVNLVIFSAPTQTRIPSLEASMTNRSTLITIVHQGGDSIPQGQFRILVDGIDQTQNFTNSGSYPWSLGETLSFNDSAMPQGAVMIYNGTGPMNGGTVILETRFPWGVYVAGDQGGVVSGGGGGGSTTNVTPLPPGSPWFDCSWGYRKNLTINHLKVPADQTNFPVLVSITADGDLSAHTQANGNDIVFTAADGVTKLNHEIESYSAGTLVAWVNVPLVSSSTDTTIMMYYGNSGAPSEQNPTAVWDSNYRGVWHLDDGGVGTRSDSTANGNYLNPRNYTGSEATTGQVDGADALNGPPTDDWLESSGNIGITGTAVRTISFWVKLANTNRCGMVGWGTANNNQEFGAGIRNTHYFAWGYNYDWDTGVVPATGAFHYQTLIYDGTTTHWYVDGSELGTGSSEPAYNTADSHVRIGFEPDPGTSS